MEIGVADCGGDVVIGQNAMWQEVNCQNAANVAAQAKAAAMQSAFATNGLGDFGIADASNNIDIQQQIAMNI